MSTVASVESPDGKSRLGLKSLMMIVALAALGFGWFAQEGRTVRAHAANKAQFLAWLAELEKANPTLQPTGSSTKTSTSLLELTTRCTTTFLTPKKQFLTIQANFRAGPLSSVRQVTFSAGERTVTWPFEEIVAGRMIDLKAEFPDTFR